MNFTFDTLTLAAGAGAAAALALTITQILKAGVPQIFGTITGATMSFVLLAILYIVGAVVLTMDKVIVDANGYLALLIAWATSATSALGLHSVANNGAATFVQGADKDDPPPQK